MTWTKLRQYRCGQFVRLGGVYIHVFSLFIELSFEALALNKYM